MSSATSATTTSGCRSSSSASSSRSASSPTVPAIRLLRRRPRGGNGQAQLLFLIFGVVAALIAPLLAGAVQAAISRQREYLADATSAMTTRDPDGLASALAKLGEYGQPLQRPNTSMAHLWIADPLRPNALGAHVRDAPADPERIERLQDDGRRRSSVGSRASLAPWSSADREDARRIAVRAQLLTADRPAASSRRSTGWHCREHRSDRGGRAQRRPHPVEPDRLAVPARRSVARRRGGPGGLRVGRLLPPDGRPAALSADHARRGRAYARPARVARRRTTASAATCSRGCAPRARCARGEIPDTSQVSWRRPAGRTTAT